MKQNIFHNLVRNEDSATEALVNLLSIKVFRDCFLASLNINNVDLTTVSHDQFTTQETVEDSRPDIILDSPELLAIFEVKTSLTRGLTSAQSTGYSEVFRKKDKQQENFRLIFIIPKHYKHIKEIEEIKGKIEENNEGIQSLIILWEDIISIIERNELGRISNYLNDFSMLLKSWYMPEKITFTLGEFQMLLDKSTPSAIEKLINIVSEIEELASEYKKTLNRPKNFS